MINDTSFRRSRRDAIKTAMLVLGASALPLGSLKAASRPRYRRYNAADPVHGARMLKSYAKAVRAMLALPPEDPRNWYRHAMLHTMDCPHGNWWFLPWHRGYIGWFEQICRELSGDPEFALPYWDWTAQPRVPDGMFDGVLDPNHHAYIGRAAHFETRFKSAVQRSGYWTQTDKVFNRRSQFGQLLIRRMRFAEDLWFDIMRDPNGRYFYEHPNARGVRRQKPELGPATQDAVALKTLYPALNARDFITFGSFKSSNHNVGAGSGILEGQPHNLIHGCVGTRDCNMRDGAGFMRSMLSSVDPIFYLHHANIDRIWDVWTRKQALRGLPTVPDGVELRTDLPDSEKSAAERATDYYRWASEPTLFFVDAKGAPVAKTRAGDYADIGEFDYDYQGGSGEDVVALPMLVGRSALAASPVVSLTGTVQNRAISTVMPGSVELILPPEVLDRMGGASHELIAKVTLNYGSMSHAPVTLVIGGPEDASGIGAGSPFYAATLAMFLQHARPGSFTYTVSIAGPLNYLYANGLLKGDGKVQLRLVHEGTMPQMGDHQGHAMGGGDIIEVEALTVESY
ncbi:MAG TPA: tyrosinase family protein [Telluria sp.]